MHFDWVLRHAGPPVLLLVDDLDRCPETFVVELLDAVQKLMLDPNPLVGDRSTRTRAPNLIVAVAADGRLIRSSYDNSYASQASAVQEAGAAIGTLFLEKIFQVTVPVPRLSDDLRERNLADLLADRTTIRDSGTANPAFVRRLEVAPDGELLGVLASAPPIERVKATRVAIDRWVVQPEAQQETRHALERFGRCSIRLPGR